MQDQEALNRNRDRLEALRGRYAGEQCVVLCTGPSLKEVDLSLIEGHPFVMGVNGTYLLRNQFHTYFAVNAFFVRNNAQRIAQVECDRLFVRWQALADCRQAGIEEKRLLLFDGPTNEISTDISTDLAGPLPLGPTVLLTIVFPFAVWCGFQEVVLLGADFPRNGYARFHTGQPDAPQQVAKPPFRYEAEMEIARFRAALWADYLRQNHPHIRVLNCSPSSDLEVFPRASLAEALG